jgi:hypothetical protein
MTYGAFIRINVNNVANYIAEYARMNDFACAISLFFLFSTIEKQHVSACLRAFVAKQDHTFFQSLRHAHLSRPFTFISNQKVVFMFSRCSVLAV